MSNNKSHSNENSNQASDEDNEMEYTFNEDDFNDCDLETGKLMYFWVPFFNLNFNKARLTNFQMKLQISQIIIIIIN